MGSRVSGGGRLGGRGRETARRELAIGRQAGGAGRHYSSLHDNVTVAKPVVVRRVETLNNVGAEDVVHR